MLSKRAKDVHRCLKHVDSFSNGQASVSEWDSELLRWIKIVLKPNGGPYQGGTYTFEINFTKHYPKSCPIVSCLTPIFHPNIDTDCEEFNVCLSLLDEWQETFGLEDLIQGLLFLLYHPNLDDPLSPLFEGYMEPELFMREVRRSLHGQEVMGYRFPRMIEGGSADAEIKEISQFSGSELSGEVDAMVDGLVEDVLEKVMDLESSHVSLFPPPTPADSAENQLVHDQYIPFPPPTPDEQRYIQAVDQYIEEVEVKNEVEVCVKSLLDNVTRIVDSEYAPNAAGAIRPITPFPFHTIEDISDDDDGEEDVSPPTRQQHQRQDIFTRPLSPNSQRIDLIKRIRELSMPVSPQTPPGGIRREDCAVQTDLPACAVHTSTCAGGACACVHHRGPIEGACRNPFTDDIHSLLDQLMLRARAEHDEIERTMRRQRLRATTSVQLEEMRYHAQRLRDEANRAMAGYVTAAMTGEVGRRRVEEERKEGENDREQQDDAKEAERRRELQKEIEKELEMRIRTISLEERKDGCTDREQREVEIPAERRRELQKEIEKELEMRIHTISLEERKERDNNELQGGDAAAEIDRRGEVQKEIEKEVEMRVQTISEERDRDSNELQGGDAPTAASERRREMQKELEKHRELRTGTIQQSILNLRREAQREVQKGTEKEVDQRTQEIEKEVDQRTQERKSEPTNSSSELVTVLSLDLRRGIARHLSTRRAEEAQHANLRPSGDESKTSEEKNDDNCFSLPSEDESKTKSDEEKNSDNCFKLPSSDTIKTKSEEEKLADTCSNLPCSDANNTNSEEEKLANTCSNLPCSDANTSKNEEEKHTGNCSDLLAEFVNRQGMLSEQTRKILLEIQSVLNHGLPSNRLETPNPHTPNSRDITTDAAYRIGQFMLQNEIGDSENGEQGRGESRAETGEQRAGREESRAETGDQRVETREPRPETRDRRRRRPVYFDTEFEYANPRPSNPSNPSNLPSNPPSNPSSNTSSPNVLVNYHTRHLHHSSVPPHSDDSVPLPANPIPIPIPDILEQVEAILKNIEENGEPSDFDDDDDDDEGEFEGEFDEEDEDNTDNTEAINMDSSFDDDEGEVRCDRLNTNETDEEEEVVMIEIPLENNVWFCLIGNDLVTYALHLVDISTMFAL